MDPARTPGGSGAGHSALDTLKRVFTTYLLGTARLGLDGSLASPQTVGGGGGLATGHDHGASRPLPGAPSAHGAKGANGTWPTGPDGALGISEGTRAAYAAHGIDLAREHVEADVPMARRTLKVSAIRRDEPRLAHQRYHMVVARYREDLSWLEGVPLTWRITVYNTGADDLQSDRYNVVPLPNTQHGKEGLIFAEHIVRAYGRGLADYTVFSQANPFDHNEHFMDLIWHPALLLPVQTMTRKFSESTPPPRVRDIHSPDPWYRSDRFSMFSMDSIYFKDCCVHTVGSIYRQHYNLSDDENLIAHTFASLGLPGWVSREQEVGSFSYGGMIGVSRNAIMQHPRQVYVRLTERLNEHVMVGYIVERMTLMLFGGASYMDRDLDPVQVEGTGHIEALPRQAEVQSGTRQLLGRELDAPKLELVVAHPGGPADVSWLDQVPLTWDVTVYESDDGAGGGLWPGRAFHRVALAEPHSLPAVVGHHFNAFYNALAQYTAFVPADALYHSPRLIPRLSQPQGLAPLQNLGVRHSDDYPPQDFLREAINGTVLRSERRSTRTLESVYYRDQGHVAAESYRHYYQLQIGDNLISTFFGTIGLPQWVSSSSDVITAAPAGMFGVRQDLVLRHTRHIYEELRQKAMESPVIAEVAEQSLLALFGGMGFNDRTQLPRRHVRNTSLTS